MLETRPRNHLKDLESFSMPIIRMALPPGDNSDSVTRCEPSGTSW